MNVDSEKARSIFSAAVENHEPHHWSEFLDRSCGQDTELRARVELLLKAHQGKDSFLDRNEEDTSAEHTVDHPLVDKPGAQIGPYKLLEVVGEGGMGIVYMAEQQRPVRRKVALKIIKPGMDTKQVVARFEAERQALAMMDHPNIARVLDAGSTQNGLPYFVMELVRGISITDFCDQYKLDTKTRLQLFKTVCQAVQHAHTKGVIHRDLKPSNVLVTLHDGEPVPKIIDFGVSKAMGQQLTEKTMFTAFTQMVGTPLYMSPEQAEMSGLDIDTRSDIYSLGVLLYELLTGSTPFDRTRLHQAAFDELRRIIREEEPDKPSTRVSSLGEVSMTVSARRSTDPSRLKQLLRGELDWIVMKTLEKDRSRRYETANGLAMEIDRYLNGDAVSACPPSATYKLRKFVRRYRSQVVVAAGFAALLLVSSAVAWYLYGEAKLAHRDTLRAQDEVVGERDRAIAAEQTAEQNFQDAKLARDRAEAERQRADRHAEELKQQLYTFNVNKAHAAYRDEDHLKARRLLEECAEPQRGWEWNYLDAKLGGAFELSFPGKVTALDISPTEPVMIVGVDGVVYAYSLTTSKRLWQQPTGNPFIPHLKFSADGKLVSVTHLSRVLDLSASPVELFDDPELSSSFEVRNAGDGELVYELSRPGNVLLGGAVVAAQVGVVTLDPRAGFSFELREMEGDRLVWSHPCGNLIPFHGDISPDGQRFFLPLAKSDFVGNPSVLYCWNVGDQSQLWSVDRTSSSDVIAVDNTTVVTGGKDHTLQVWDAATGMLIEELESGLSDYAVSLDVSQDGKHLVSRGHENVAIWDWENRRVERSLKSRVDWGPTVRISGDGQSIALLNWNTTSVPVLTVEPPPPTAVTLSGHEDELRCVAFDPDGDNLASVASDGTMRVWSSRTGQELQLRIVDSTAARALAYAPDGVFFATGGTDGVKLWHTQSGKQLHHWKEIGDTYWIQFSSDGSRIAAGGRSHLLKVWNVADGQELLSSETVGIIDGLAFGSTNGSVLVLNDTGAIQSFHVESGQSDRLNTPEDLPASACRCLATRDDANVIAVGVQDHIELWDVSKRTIMMRLRNGTSKVRSLAFDRSGNRIYSGDEQGILRVWDVASGELVFESQAHSGPNTTIYSLSLSPDGKTVATAGTDGLIKLWETTRPAPEVAEERRVVAEATDWVNQRYRKSSRLTDVTSSLMTAPPQDKGVAQVATDLIRIRGDRPRGPMRVTDTVVQDADVLDHIEQLKRELVDLVERKSGIPVDQSAESISPLNIDAGFSRIAYEVGKWPIESLLDSLIDEYPDAHHFAYIRGQSRARCGLWSEAEKDLTLALSRMPRFNEAWHWQAYQLMALYVYLGETDKHRELCEQALEDLPKLIEYSPDPDFQVGLSGRMIKACLLRADVVDNADLPVDALRLVLDQGTEQDWFPAWGWGTRALLAYRRGDSTSTIQYVARSEEFEPSDSAHALNLAVLAMAEHHLQHADAAKQALEDATQFITQLKAVPGSERDLLIARILLREAKAKIEGSSE